jgi:hypothetical protein
MRTFIYSLLLALSVQSSFAHATEVSTGITGAAHKDCIITEMASNRPA